MMPRLEVRAANALTDLPAEALALFGPDFFGSIEWYRVAASHGLPAGSTPVFLSVWAAAKILAVWPMRRDGGRLGALTTPYTLNWAPLLAPGLDAPQLEAIGLALASAFRRSGTVRLDALDGDAASWPPLLAGLRAGGLRAQNFDHFGNWHQPLGAENFAAYLAARPGALRESIRRHSRRLANEADGGFRIFQGGPGLEGALADFARIYGASWKPAEPCAAFIPALIRDSAAHYSLRLGFLAPNGQAIATQLWTLNRGIATLHKLAHDQRWDKSSPGTVLTARMIAHLIDQDGAQALDFGRGDDAYKKLWVEKRRQRSGLLLMNPWHPAGASALVRARAAGALRRVLQR